MPGTARPSKSQIAPVGHVVFDCLRLTAEHERSRCRTRLMPIHMPSRLTGFSVPSIYVC